MAEYVLQEIKVRPISSVPQRTIHVTFASQWNINSLPSSFELLQLAFVFFARVHYIRCPVTFANYVSLWPPKFLWHDFNYMYVVHSDNVGTMFNVSQYCHNCGKTSANDRRFKLIPALCSQFCEFYCEAN